MNIRGRLLIHAALVPSLAIAGLVGAGGLLLRRALLESVDENLMAQAAVESISLFDLEKMPHLHLDKSPLRSEIESFSASRAVYGPDGRRLVMDSGRAPLPETFPVEETTDTKKPVLRTLLVHGASVRELRLRVIAPDHRPHTLLLRSSLDRIDETVNTYYRVMGIAALVFMVGLALIQARVSRWWSDRLANMIEHTRRVAQGDMGSRPRPDSTSDEIGELTVALTRAAERLEQARQAQDRLVADAAHELKTPLAAMRAEIDVALRRTRDVEALRETLSEVRDEVDRLDALSSRLLDLTRLAHAAWNLEASDARAILDAAIESHRPLATERGIELDVFGPERLEVKVDPIAIRQAFDNLLTNAIKFSPERGRITARLEVELDRWRLTVHDEGLGIPPSERESVFDPFHRVDARTPGTGLGLAIVRDVALRHGARAFVADTKAGTTLVFEAPVSPEVIDSSAGVE